MSTYVKKFFNGYGYMYDVDYVSTHRNHHKYHKNRSTNKMGTFEHMIFYRMILDQYYFIGSNMCSSLADALGDGVISGADVERCGDAITKFMRELLDDNSLYSDAEPLSYCIMRYMEKLSIYPSKHDAKKLCFDIYANWVSRWSIIDKYVKVNAGVSYVVGTKYVVAADTHHLHKPGDIFTVVSIYDETGSALTKCGAYVSLKDLILKNVTPVEDGSQVTKVHTGFRSMKFWTEGDYEPLYVHLRGLGYELYGNATLAGSDFIVTSQDGMIYTGVSKWVFANINLPEWELTNEIRPTSVPKG